MSFWYGFLAGFIIGLWLVAGFIYFYDFGSSGEPTTQGLWVSNVTKDRAKQIAYKYEPSGDWVMVNVDGMTYERCIEVVRHECAHELWGEICEKNDEMCKKGQELLTNYSRKNKIIPTA